MNFSSELLNKGNKTPAFSISIEGRDITTVLDNRLMSLTLTDNRGFEADQLDLELDDADGKIVLPRRGRRTTKVALLRPRSHNTGKEKRYFTSQNWIICQNHIRPLALQGVGCYYILCKNTCVCEVNKLERRFYLVDEQVLPEVFLKVVRAKELLASGEARSISAATRAVDLSRSAFYKYKDCIFDSENGREVVTVMATLRDETGALQSLLAGISLGIVLERLLYYALGAMMAGGGALTFNISVEGIRTTLILFAIIHLLIFLSSRWQIRLANPIQLLHGSMNNKISFQLVVTGRTILHMFQKILQFIYR